jgi:hypothetical protein
MVDFPGLLGSLVSSVFVFV